MDCADAGREPAAADRQRLTPVPTPRRPLTRARAEVGKLFAQIADDAVAPRVVANRGGEQPFGRPRRPAPASAFHGWSRIASRPRVRLAKAPCVAFKARSPAAVTVKYRRGLPPRSSEGSAMQIGRAHV